VVGKIFEYEYGELGKANAICPVESLSIVFPFAFIPKKDSGNRILSGNPTSVGDLPAFFKFPSKE